MRKRKARMKISPRSPYNDCHGKRSIWIVKFIRSKEPINAKGG
jgi:hypothetical protein